MGRIGSSSRRKHSKKKSLKVSPEARRKKKIERNKSKKLRRHDDSFSSFSEDESTSSSLLSSSSSDGEYKSRRSRSRARNEVKGSKKRTRSGSLREDSPPVKKRKGSKNSDSRKKNKKIKKKKKKKKQKRDAYISSASSDSASCSTCKDGDSSDDEEGSRGRSREKKKNHRDSNKGRDGNRKNRSKTRSPSPSKLSNSYDDEIIEEVPVENNSRRLKSVITIAEPPENEPKEEIVYDYDDYPSCKSNDSNELVDRLNISPEKKIPTSVIGEVNSASSPNEKESNVSGNIGPEVDNLESILRQKALENLSKFRGGLKTKPVVAVVDKHKSDQSVVVKQPTSASVSMSPVSQPVVPRSRFTWRRDPAATTLKDEKAVANTGPDSSGSQPAAAPKLQSAEKKIVNETTKSVASTNNTSGTGTNVDQKSTAALETPSASTKEGSSKGQQTETNDNSQFEKKTMSVMRGGEMVQVSYKVYIPNRAPALARRRLKR